MAKVGQGFLILWGCLALPARIVALSLSDTAYLGVSGGWVAGSNDDMRALVPGSIVPEQWGPLGMIKLGFLSESSFWIEAAYRQGPSRQFTEAKTRGVYTFHESTLSIEPGVRMALTKRAMLGAGIALGLSSDNFSYKSPLVSQSYSGSGFSFSPEARISLAFNRIGIDLDFGYHISKSGVMKDEAGAPLVVTSLATGQPAAWSMDQSGFFLRLGIVLYYGKPVKDDRVP